MGTLYELGAVRLTPRNADLPEHKSADRPGKRGKGQEKDKNDQLAEQSEDESGDRNDRYAGRDARPKVQIDSRRRNRKYRGTPKITVTG